MKFVVNRVHKSSIHKESDVQGCEVVFNISLNCETSNRFERKGFISGYFVRNGWEGFCCGFTIAEIDDEGYLL